MLRACLIILAFAAPHAPATAAAATSDILLRDALAAEARLETQRALDLFLEAEKSRPDDPLLLQKIARQYSDRIVDLRDPAEMKASAARALEYAQRALALQPDNAVNVLSVAISYGKLGLYSDTKTKVAHSRRVREGAERALVLDPDYAWAHHVLGRWHHEVAALGTAARLGVRIFYGGLPDASPAAAVKHLTRAVELEPGELAHLLELGFALLAAGNEKDAHAAFEKGLAMPSRAKHDEAAKTRAREALQQLERK